MRNSCKRDLRGYRLCIWRRGIGISCALLCTVLIVLNGRLGLALFVAIYSCWILIDLVSITLDQGFWMVSYCNGSYFYGMDICHRLASSEMIQPIFDLLVIRTFYSSYGGYSTELNARFKGWMVNDGTSSHLSKLISYLSVSKATIHHPYT